MNNSTLILGCSGSGKTQYIKNYVKTVSLPVYIINAKESDVPDNFEIIDYTDVDEIHNAILIFEDIVRPSEFESKVINTTLVKLKRHNSLVVFVISHHIQKNGLHSIITHFDEIIFSKNVKNTSMFKHYAKRYCPIDEQESLNRWSNFLKTPGTTHYLRYNVISSTFDYLDEQGKKIISQESIIRKEVQRFIEPFGSVNECLALYDYLVKILPPLTIGEDLILTLEKRSLNPPAEAKKTPKQMHLKLKINVIDLISYVSNTNFNSEEPPEEIIVAFKSLRELYKIPFIFIRNKKFL